MDKNDEEHDDGAQKRLVSVHVASGRIGNQVDTSEYSLWASEPWFRAYNGKLQPDAKVVKSAASQPIHVVGKGCLTFTL